MTNLYDTLGLKKNATQDEIKRAYKQLAIQNHPDKGGDEKKFQEISNAYDVLGDQKKRQEYDNGGNQFRGRNNCHADIFAHMFGQRMNGGNQKKQHSCSDIIRNYKISLKEAYTGTIKNLKIKLKAFHFNKIKECEECNGIGRIKNIQHMGVFTQIFETSCNKCKTSGFIETKDAVYEEEKNITLNIPKGVINGHKITINECGEQPKLKNIKPGNLIFNIEIDKNDTFIRDGNNLHSKINISFLHSIIGANIKYSLFDVDFFEFNTNQFNIVHPNKKYEIKNRGMPIMHNDKKGSLFIEFIIDYPELNNEKRDYLENNLKSVFSNIDIL